MDKRAANGQEHDHAERSAKKQKTDPVDSLSWPINDPARSYPFELDEFQKLSIAAIAKGESVLVSAHTSAGKTVVAEYAIAQSLKRNQRVIYTSPVKALSNQKYREFLEKFGDVGLMTGDVTINENATCLVMTTEILRSMLYRGSEVVRELQWVIFDEIHYLRDATRGVVWEEVLIMLPHQVRYVFLSATIPNAMQFAEWIAKIHHQPCHVIYTNFRPTPLQNYLFPPNSNGIYLVVDEKGSFRDENFSKALSALSCPGSTESGIDSSKRSTSKKNAQDGKFSDIRKLVKMVMLKSYNPAIVFSFSKRECETLALQLSSLTFNNEDEKALVGKVFENATLALGEEDRNLPQISHILPLLRRGIGIHHSGLLPILKEVIEILFQEGLIKILFATETFSIGLNMPAKTVIFTSLNKFDGLSRRLITSSEYTQMAGRAGRRGIDDRGIAIIMLESKIEPDGLKGIISGEQDLLLSAFHLSNTMLLNLARNDGVQAEFMIQNSFHEFQSVGKVSILEEDVRQLEAKSSEICIPNEASVRDYFDLRTSLDGYSAQLRSLIFEAPRCDRFLSVGRIVSFRKDSSVIWGVVIRPEKVKFKASSTVGRFLVGFPDSHEGLPMVAIGEKASLQTCVITNEKLMAISSVKIFIPNGTDQNDRLTKINAHLSQVLSRFPDGPPLLDPVTDMGFTDKQTKELTEKIELLEAKLVSHHLHRSKHVFEYFAKFAEKAQILERIKCIKREIIQSRSANNGDNLKFRRRFLRRLGYLDDHDVVTLKGRVACEISCADEILLAELLFAHFFQPYTPEQCAALLSCFVAEESAKSPESALAEALVIMNNQAKEIARVAKESKLDVTEVILKGTLVPPVLAWAEGQSFSSICKLTDCYEGSLLRSIRRLQELLRQLILAAALMGNNDLELKFTKALDSIWRGIISMQSLYV
ncbi:antiviral helicase [Ascobolus immersus RN42]|uniref:Antiviral helicase n=1 Tax=Ascobolus immersus RN42 TaxID=1160509 RepID=A0A3N4IC63_ASCIM|nr:antiviral helicase [Ascobolus immersus RN42]